MDANTHQPIGRAMTETFPIIPGQVRMLWVVVPLLLVALGAAGVLAYTVAASRTARFEVSPDGLRLRGDFYGRFIPASELQAEAARVIDLRTERALQPVMRTGGTAVPGYRAGWFRLRDGERALLYVTDPRHVAYVPTRAGYSVLLSVADPAAFIASLHRLSTESPASAAPGV
ncbi:MAG TPA: PH domain-containing protein [Gaiellaceae bacterium]|nr:PH domain-containing protein [Gaiellaceae bacterium]